MRDFRELRVWQRAHELAVGVYKATVAFPRDETYGLRSQIRRAAGSIPANIAEGCGKRLPRDQARHCQIAMGSACELEYHLLLAKDVGILPEGDWTQLNEGVVAVKQMLTGLIRRLITDGGRRTADGGRRTA